MSEFLALEGKRGLVVGVANAASGIQRFDDLLERTRRRAPQHNLADKDDVGAMAAFLVSDRARTLTGNTIYIDAGDHVVG